MEEAGTSQNPFPPFGRRMIDEFHFSGRKFTAIFGLDLTIRISNDSQVSLTNPLTRSATSPVNTLYRYFVTQTKWYSI